LDKDRKKIRSHSTQAKLSLQAILKSIGPSIITGAADNDPSAITTYSQAGAKFGFGLLWLVIFLYPFITVIVGICARIGIVTGSGLTSIISRKYSKKIALPIVSLLLIANIINIGADLGAISASFELLFPQIPIIIISIIFSAVILLAEIFISYNKYSRILRYLTLTLFVYFITALIVGGNWNEILSSSLLPHIELSSEFLMMIVAIFGSALSPYLLFWQTSEEAEEDVAKNKLKEIRGGRFEKLNISNREIKLVKVDVAIGMAFAVFIMWSIMVTTAGSLHANEIYEIQTAKQAAQALEPLVKRFPYSGETSEIIFAIGIIGTGLLAIPVLAGTCGYALSDLLGWKEGLSKKFSQAIPFYLVILISTFIGLIINYVTAINPIQMLLYAATINGIILVPILVLIMRIAIDKDILGNRINGLFSNVVGWSTVIILSVSVLAFMFLNFFKLLF